MKRFLVAGFAALFPAVAFAQAVAPPTNIPCGRSITACQQVIPRTNVLTWLPGLVNDVSSTTNFTNTGSGHTGVMAYEMPADTVAVALILGNGLTTSETLSEATIAPSTMWGSNNPAPGVIPYAQNGNQDTGSFIPVTWGNSGRASTPWPGSNASYTAAESAGRTIITLNTSAATSSGSPILTFPSVENGSLAFSGGNSGGAPAAGMYVFDGLGCIPPGTKISSTTSTTITLTNNVQDGTGADTAGCSSGQLIAFSWGSPGPLSVNVPPATNPGVPQLVVSDWMPLVSYTRRDNPYVGQTITEQNGCIPANTTITSVTPWAVTISQPTTCSITATLLTSTTKLTTTVDNPAGTSIITVPSTAMLRASQTLTASVGFGSAQTVFGVQDSSHVVLYSTTSADMPAGSTITSVNTFYASGMTIPTGSTVIVPEGPLDARPLLLLRYFMTQSTVWSRIYPFGNTPFVESVNYNMPGIRTGVGPTGTDGVNFPSATMSGTGAGIDDSPIWGIMFLTKQNGIECMPIGDSHMEGTMTSSGWASAFRRGCYDMAVAGNVPVEVANVAHYGWTEQQWQPLAADMMQLARPGVIFQPTFTGNGRGNPQDIAGGTIALDQFAQTIGSKIVLTMDYPTNASTILSAQLAASVNSSPTGIMNMIPPTTSTVSGVAVTCTGCTAGLTATLPLDSNTITFSTPQTLNAGTVLQFNVINATTTNASTAVNLATPAPYTGLVLVAGANIPASDKLTINAGSESATLSVAATGTGATTLTLSGSFGQEFTRGHGNAQFTGIAGPQQTVIVLDPNPFLTNYSSGSLGPQLNPGLTWDGLHIHDGGVSLYEKNLVLPTLLQMRGNN